MPARQQRVDGHFLTGTEIVEAEDVLQDVALGVVLPLGQAHVIPIPAG